MKQAGYITFAIGLAFVGLATPGLASAASISVQTAQVIPAGGGACAPLAVQSVTPYVVDNQLNSFDVTIADPQYVSILATVGNTGVPFNFMTRWKNPDGLLRIHVDVQSTPIYGSLPITLTLISAQTGQPVCLSTVAFSVLGNASAPVSRPVSSTGTHPTTATKPSAPATTTVMAPSTTTVVGSVTGVPLSERLQRMCAGNGSLELWFVLITLYLVGTALVALADPSLTKRSLALPGALIGVPLVLLAAAWYLVPVCRGASWVPLILFLIAIVGSLVAYREKHPVLATLLLPPAKQTPVALLKQKQAITVKN